MDQSEQYQKLKTATQFNKYHEFLKKTLQFAVPVSLLSFLIHSYSLGFSFFFQYLDFEFSLFSHTPERKYIFLICNGILAFLLKNSGLSTPSGSPAKSNAEFGRNGEHGVKPVPAVGIASPEEVSPVEEEVSEKQQNGYLNTESEERDLIRGSEENEGEDGEEVVEERGRLIPPSATEEGDEVDISTEELNRKFDEFIRKTKEEIRIEAQRTLIAV
ncbi:uncharacterized protein LOC132278840 [Cornus florida]|uniref:uncharacterized protein LOC132278840 n=1 Tax=Cornus florida TaxID=4283 RepID=UPI0028982EF4|nr:uncharacterized protein LOC132278840 [Cornus florida]